MATPALVVGTNTYQTVADADAYLASLIHTQAWAFVDANTKCLALITAFTDIQQLDLVFEGSAIDPANAPAGVKAAQAELAFAYSQDADLATSATTGGTNTKRVQAGSAQVEFFRPQEGGRFPTRVLRILAPFMPSSSGALGVPGGSFTTGANDRSSFDDFDRGPLREGFA